MKTKSLVLLFAFVVLTVGIVNAQKNAIIKFDTTTYNFGKIHEDSEKPSFNFKFSNIGSDTLKLINVKAGCSCTTLDWTKKSVLPGKEGNIKVQFDPKGKSGLINKAITVISNATEPVKVLVIIGEVIP
ncbi:MAG: DUF1573 domain-containing protein [Bacteroidetes bacterium]|nr:DUF1573 domain-containing protein [Bacteroidota bacterium]